MDAFQLLEDSGHVAPPDDATVEAAVDLVLADAFHEQDALADALSIRRGQLRVPRRRAYLAGAAAVLAAAAATAIPPATTAKIRAYSAAAAPDSSFRNETKLRIG